MIANDFRAEHAVPAGKRVLVLTKDWLLLQQLAEDLCQREAAGLFAGFVFDRDEGLRKRSSRDFFYVVRRGVPPEPRSR